MPHLAPMSWILTPITFIILLCLFIASIWWHQTAEFPALHISSTHNKSRWNWS
uniref:ATP synthase F0 subunit 8 n=1 Tax=Glycera cf. tridactyla FS20 TaxID=1763830 RepID=A0A0S3CR00_9ANNE|nr:ATP synthase F0 subunit 8 [Glycera cf. tridactyla FS20]